jgi:Fur family transcriptional regulator, ferric uptake regulator
VPKPHSERKLFTGYLGEHSLKMTRERRMILDEIFALDGHFGADDLYLKLVKRKIAVYRATVYRTLEHLVGSGLVQKVYLSDHTQRKALYERAHGRRHHEHMHCVSCGRIIEFTDDPLEARQAEVCRRLGFKPLRHSLRIEGICADCQKRP